MVFRIALIAVVLALSLGVLYIGANGLGFAVGGIGSALGGFVNGVTSTPAPKSTLPTIIGAPSLEQPIEPYTSDTTVDLVVTVPAALAGDPNHRIRVYLTLPDQPPTPITESPLADTIKTVIPTKLEKGINDFTVTIVGLGVESDPSAVVRYVFDDAPPKITITSPKNGAVVNAKAVVVKGKTQARTTLLAHNAANASSIVGTSGSDGTFSLSLSLSSGVNDIVITGTDPAGNVAEAKLSVKRGTGKLTVVLTASTYKIKRSKLPEPITLFATVTDPDGLSLPEANVTFTLAMPGIPVITIDAVTDPDGKASFTTPIPKGATVGQGSATVLVTTNDFGSIEDFTVISIVK